MLSPTPEIEMTSPVRASVGFRLARSGWGADGGGGVRFV